MKNIFILLVLFLSVTAIHSQQNKIKKTIIKPAVSNTASIQKKRIETIKIKGNLYDVYWVYEKKLMSEQTPQDTLIWYDFTFKNTKGSAYYKESQKYATIKGKIAREGFYKVKNDTLVVTVNYYDPYHGGRLIDYYVPDKKGYLREVKSEMKAIDTDTVSDRYIKTERMKAP
ncbi:hypothetical protein [Flavobacterium panacagri]|uniref:hypothetical protein n=1 Tax=Flavobacterium panacagri TaxID=3034146 RepID=UPI0025A52451|nr:hypothetical protein [Flavobacterium panacagri]